MARKALSCDLSGKSQSDDNVIQQREELGQRPCGEEVLGVSKKQKEDQCDCRKEDRAGLGRAEVKSYPEAGS